MLALLILIIATGIYAFHQRKRAIAGLCFFQIVALYVCSTPLVPSLLLRPLQEEFIHFKIDNIPDHSTVVVLGAGGEKLFNEHYAPAIFSFGRIATAYMLLQQCQFECQILLSGGDVHHIGLSEAEIYANFLQRMGVKPQQVLLESDSLNTWQNARNTAQLLHKEKNKRIFLVTSAVHLKRSLLYFRHFGIAAIPVFADYLAPIDSMLPNSYNAVLTEIAVHEYIGLLRYHVYNAVGLNEPATHAPL